VLEGEKLYLLPVQGFGLMCELSKFDVAVVVELR